MTRMRCVFLSAVVALAAWTPADLSAADEWIEVNSANFTVLSNASERSTRRLAWQIEQVRSAMAALWAWARVDLNKPLTVIALKDESSMRAIAPRYWEERGGTRPASAWVAGQEQHYLAIRTDIEIDGSGNINPHSTAYFTYIGLVMGQNMSRDLPFWFTRGVTAVLSNTIVRDDHLLLGPPIPWHLQLLQQRAPMPLPKLLTITASSPEFTRQNGGEVYEAQVWAFVHFLMFGESGARAGKLNQFAQMVSSGKDVPSALQETIGSIEALEGPFRAYIDRRIYQMRRVEIDVSVARERLPVRKVAAGESAARRAMFHVAMRRPNEANALIAEARKLEPANAASYAAEAILLDVAKKPVEARAAYTSAAERGSTSAYVYYRLAGLSWTPSPSRETLLEVEKHLSKAIELNTQFAAAYAWLADVRASLNPAVDSIGLVRRAIALEPNEAGHRLRAGYVLLRQRKIEEAKADAQAALALADNDEDRRQAERLLQTIQSAPKRD